MGNPTRLEEGNELYNFYEEKNHDSNNISFHLFEAKVNRKCLKLVKN